VQLYAEQAGIPKKVYILE